MNPLQEKLNELKEFLMRDRYYEHEMDERLTAFVNETLEEAKRIVAESGEDYHEAYKALDKMKL